MQLRLRALNVGSTRRDAISGYTVSAMWRTIGFRVVAIAGAVSGVVAIATQWGLWPIGVVVLLSVCLAAALWASWSSRIAKPEQPQNPGRYASRHEHEHDWTTVRDVRALIPREHIEWLRDWDFGGGWRASETDRYSELHRLDNVEHVPFDDELNRALRELFDAGAVLRRIQLEYGDMPDGEWFNVGWTSGQADGLVGAERDEWERRQKLFNDAADAIADAYDGFMDTARRKLLL